MLRRRADLERDYETLLDFQRLSWYINFPGEPFAERTFRQSLGRGIRFDEVYVYLDGDELVGWLWLDLGLSNRRVHIRHLQVAEERWGEGIGRRILEDVIRMARERGRTEVTLNVTKGNERAMRLYTGLGFRVERDRGARQSMRLHLPRERDISIYDRED